MTSTAELATQPCRGVPPISQQGQGWSHGPSPSVFVGGGFAGRNVSVRSSQLCTRSPAMATGVHAMGHNMQRTNDGRVDTRHGPSTAQRVRR
jgi:hypothetical protein